MAAKLAKKNQRILFAPLAGFLSDLVRLKAFRASSQSRPFLPYFEFCWTKNAGFATFFFAFDQNRL
jgi:hypothetical protein